MKKKHTERDRDYSDTVRNFNIFLTFRNLVLILVLITSFTKMHTSCQKNWYDKWYLFWEFPLHAQRCFWNVLPSSPNPQLLPTPLLEALVAIRNVCNSAYIVKIKLYTKLTCEG